LLREDGLIAVVHAASRDEVNAGHARTGAALARDVLPPGPEMERLLREAGFTQIALLDEPGRYLATGRVARSQ